MDPINEIQQAISLHAFTLPSRAWIYEADRWENLIFSIIRQYCDQDPDKAGTAVSILRDMNLIDIDELSTTSQIPLEFNSAFNKIMLGLDFSQEDVQEISQHLVNVAVAVKAKYDGKIQAIFRKYGEMIRQELVNAFSDDHTPNEKIYYGVSLWLQSAFGLPILSEKPTVKDYCTERNIKKDELSDIADELDINLGVLDYFIDNVSSKK